MALCPFATWKPFSGPSGPYTGGPFKIVHHTTEGSSASGAFGAYQANHSDPHFTVDATTIYQHIDTGVAARALRNDTSKPLQTNRDGAIQIEVVGFAHLPKNPATLRNVAKLCRWIEAKHGVPQIWPNGEPKTAVNGHDPGGHNRNPTNWDTKGGHYGHCHVPENTHWDPGYTHAEVTAIMQLQFDDEGDAIRDDGVEALAVLEADVAAAIADAQTTMPDHHGMPAEAHDEAAAALAGDAVADGAIEVRLDSGHTVRISKSGDLGVLKKVLKELAGSHDVIAKGAKLAKGAPSGDDTSSELDLKPGMFREGSNPTKMSIPFERANFGSVNKDVTVTELNGRLFYEGDICLGAAAQPGAVAKGIVRTGDEFRWSHGIVPWIAQASIRSRVKDAIKHWEDNTPIQFPERTTETDFISFEALDGCWSSVGRQGGMQRISLATGCGLGAAIHEIGHALGLWHEQSREDRDQFIKVQLENVEEQHKHNFDKHVLDGDDVGDYDFGSIMHYPPKAFSKNGKPTIIASNGEDIGQRHGLSDRDINTIRSIYPDLDWDND